MAVEKGPKTNEGQARLPSHRKKKNIKLLGPHNVMDEGESLMDILKA